MTAEISNLINPSFLKSTGKGLVQLVLIYLFVFMTAFDSQKLNNTDFKKILDSPISHFAIIFGIYYTMNQNASLTTSAIIAFIITSIFVLLNVIEFMESNLHLIESKTSVDPRVKNMKASEIFEYFNSDISELRKAFKESNIPEDAVLNDYTAPEIATQLLYVGHKLV